MEQTPVQVKLESPILTGAKLALGAMITINAVNIGISLIYALVKYYIG